MSDCWHRPPNLTSKGVQGEGVSEAIYWSELQHTGNNQRDQVASRHCFFLWGHKPKMLGPVQLHSLSLTTTYIFACVRFWYHSTRLQHRSMCSLSFSTLQISTPHCLFWLNPIYDMWLRLSQTYFHIHWTSLWPVLSFENVWQSGNFLLVNRPLFLNGTTFSASMGVIKATLPALATILK